MPSIEGRAGGVFATLVLLNAFVGGMVGIERATLPLLAEREFGIATTAGALSFLLTFGASKAITNLAAGHAADVHGRKRVLVAGWLLAAPVPLLILYAPTWWWIVGANALLGVSQGLAWSMTLNMKLDLATPRGRGLTAGLNEFAGYTGLAIAAAVAGFLAASLGLRGAPGIVGLVIAGCGIAIAIAVPETARRDAAASPPGTLRAAFRDGTWRDATLSTASAAGLATNLKDGILWGLLPLVLAARGLPLAHVALVAALYPAAWGVSQLATGPLSDKLGRRPLLVAGFAMQAGGLALFALAHAYAWSLVAAVIVGAGTALAYPTLLALVADHAPAATRASSLGVYRFWRDSGYVAGALLAAGLAPRVGMDGTIGAAAALVAAAGALLAWRAVEGPLDAHDAQEAKPKGS